LENKSKNGLVWLRRDLRDHDHAALYQALKENDRVYCVFIFDTEILSALPQSADRRVEFIYDSVIELHHALQAHGGGLIVRHGRPCDEIPKLAHELKITAVYLNHDYEPNAIIRDQEVAAELQIMGVDFFTFKDQVIFEKEEILTQEKKPFSVFTPYKNAWLKQLSAADLKAYPVENYREKLAFIPQLTMPRLEQMGFTRTNLKYIPLPTGMFGARMFFNDFISRIDHYHEWRDYPAYRGPSYLSVHLRFGTISIRALARAAVENNSPGAQVWLSELIWRDFYFMILYHYPRVVDRAFKPKFDAIPFTNDKQLFRAWREGRTGYPIVDAAMRQINQTGYMHNRLRMIVASFLVKDLHIDWRWGERYFAEHLNDYDLAANNGNWQWAASTGCDAQPYFRIFNPVTQSQKFDPQGAFIRLYLPELENVSDKFIHAPWLMNLTEQKNCSVMIGKNYPAPVVDHERARVIALELYKMGGKS
jgi:deoxyribodipyrimidine photo-lyase